MKILGISTVLMSLLFAVNASAQVSSSLTANNHPTFSAPPTAPKQTRTRVVSTEETTNVPTTWGNSPLTIVADNNVKRSVSNANSPAVAVPSISQTQTYRVGVGDILDIQLPESLSTQSTLYTVMDGGLIDYPLAGGALQIGGLTTEAIAARLQASIKVLDKPTVVVKVRDYASHTVKIIGFVNAPGSKVLRREAVPLYVILAEAMPLAEATSVTVVRNGVTVATIGIREANSSNQLVMVGDLVKVSGI